MAGARTPMDGRGRSTQAQGRVAASRGAHRLGFVGLCTAEKAGTAASASCREVGECTGQAADASGAGRRRRAERAGERRQDRGKAEGDWGKGNSDVDRAGSPVIDREGKAWGCCHLGRLGWSLGCLAWAGSPGPGWQSRPTQATAGLRVGPEAGLLAGQTRPLAARPCWAGAGRQVGPVLS